MNTSNFSSDILIPGCEAHPVRLDSLKRFLKQYQWRLIANPNDNLLIYEGPSDDQGHPIKLGLPTSEDFEDTPVMVSKALSLLSAINSWSILDTSAAIMNFGSDFFRQRIITPSNQSSIPLETADIAIHSLKNLIYYSACLEEDPQPFFGRGRNIGKKYSERSRFCQTFVGSFGLTIEMPLSPPSSDNPDQIPFERRIMTRIAHGMLILKKAIQEADVSILTQDYKEGFNANLFETMQALMSSLLEHQIEFSFSWSSEYVLPEELVKMPLIRLSADSVLPLLETAAKSLRRKSESQNTEITGKIVRLYSDSKNDEESDSPEEFDGGNRMIVIDGKTAEGKSITIRSFVSPEEYKQACDAHRDEKIISIKGKPEKTGKYFILTSSSNFKILTQ